MMYCAALLHMMHRLKLIRQGIGWCWCYASFTLSSKTRERERERDEYQRKTITCTWCLCNNRQVALALSARHAIIIIIIIGDDQADLPPIEHTVLCRTVLYCINKSPTSVQRRAVLGPVPRCLFIPTTESALPPFQGHESGSK